MDCGSYAGRCLFVPPERRATSPAPHPKDLEGTAMSATARASATASSAGWLSGQDCHLDDLVAIVGETTDRSDYPHAAAVDQNVPVYGGDRLLRDAASAERRRALQSELARALLDGPGIVVVQRAFP